jgi:hypothetical protein
LAATQGWNGVARINQDVQVFASELAKDDQIAHKICPKRHAWLHVVRDAVSLNGTTPKLATRQSCEESLVLTGANAEHSETLDLARMYHNECIRLTQYEQASHIDSG